MVHNHVLFIYSAYSTLRVKQVRLVHAETLRKRRWWE